jgi:hypothetical protein
MYCTTVCQGGTTRLELGLVMARIMVLSRQHKWMGFAPEEATLIQIVRAVCTLDDIEHVRRTLHPSRPVAYTPAFVDYTHCTGT